MATRFYLANAAPDAEIATLDLSGLGWEQLQPSAALKKASIAITNTSQTPSDGGGLTANINRLGMAFATEPLTAQSIAGVVKGQIRCQELFGTDDRAPQCQIKVVNGDGSVVRGTLIAFDNSALSNEFATSLTNRKFPRGWSGSGAAITAVDAQAGDRILIEIGFRRYDTSGSAVTFDFRDDAGSDLGENETDTAALNSWMEFSAGILFQSGAGSLIPKRMAGVIGSQNRGRW